MKILIINGPNLNLLGKRDPTQYGSQTLTEINELLTKKAAELDSSIQLEFFQSNHEGAIIDFIQEHADSAGLIINPGAYTHYSYAIADALRDFSGKKVEVHLSDIGHRESFRSVSVTAAACGHQISGKKELSYVEGLEWVYRELI